QAKSNLLGLKQPRPWLRLDGFGVRTGPGVPRPDRPLIEQLLCRVAWWRSATQSRARKIRAILLSALVTGATTPLERGQPLAREPRWGHPPSQRIMATRAETSDLGRALDAFGIKQRSVAQWFCTSERNIRRWKSGARKTPPAVAVVVQLMMAGKVTVADVELAAASISARTNGGAEDAPPVSLEEPPAPLAEVPEQSVPTRAPAAALAILALW